MASVTVEIDQELFARLQKVAVPLVDDLNSVLTKLLDHWDALAFGPYQGQPPLPHDPLMTSERLEDFVEVAKRTDAELARNLELARQITGDPESAAAQWFGKLSDLVKSPPQVYPARWRTRDSATRLGTLSSIALDNGAKPTHFLTSKGVALPVDMRLFADYQGKRLNAVVTEYGINFNGVMHSNPSQAAMAAKQSMGASPKASSTNGWTFWLIDEPSLDMAAKPLDVFRKAAGAAAEQEDGSEA